MKKIILTCVRHGEANHNVESKADQTETPVVPYNDDGVLDTPLTPRGRIQVVQVGDRLSDHQFDLAISSDLRRARDTALAILGEIIISTTDDSILIVVKVVMMEWSCSSGSVSEKDSSE